MKFGVINFILFIFVYCLNVLEGGASPLNNDSKFPRKNTTNTSETNGSGHRFPVDEPSAFHDLVKSIDTKLGQVENEFKTIFNEYQSK